MMMQAMREKVPSQISSAFDQMSERVVKKTAMKAAPMQSATNSPLSAPAQTAHTTSASGTQLVSWLVHFKARFAGWERGRWRAVVLTLPPHAFD